MKEGDKLWRSLIDSGFSVDTLTKFVKAGCPRKFAGATPLLKEDLKIYKKHVMSDGGSISGGTAIRSFLGQKGEDRDVDVFFRTFEDFAKAHLAAINYSNVDICLYQHKPWELFDLEASCCATSLAGFSCSPKFEEVWETKKSDVRLDCIVHPLATLRRVVKYGDRYGLKFPGDKVALMATSTTEIRIIGQAMKHVY